VDNYVYLAGPMEDVAHEEMKSWRINATQFLDMFGIQTLDPTRRISFHDELLENKIKTKDICNRIFKQDLNDINESLVILADIRRGSGRGIGTAMELMYAYTKKKNIILWADNSDLEHPFLESIATEKCYDLYEALETTVSYYNK